MRQKTLLLLFSATKILIFYFAIVFFLNLIAKSAIAAPLPESDNPNPITDLEVVFSNVLGTITLFAGFACFIMIIVSGFRYITAQGDPKAIAAAQSSLVWAIAGVAFIIIAWLILEFISKFTGLDITFFRLRV